MLYFKKINGKLAGKRDVTVDEEIAKKMWGTDNYFSFDEVDVPDCGIECLLEDLDGNGDLQVDPVAIVSKQSVLDAIDLDQARSTAFNGLRATFDYSKAWADMTLTERKLVSNNIDAMTDSELGVA